MLTQPGQGLHPSLMPPSEQPFAHTQFGLPTSQNPSVLTEAYILPKQETFPETEAKNCTKATSITGLSVTVRGNS